MKNNYLRLMAYLALGTMLGLVACKSINQSTGLRTNSKVHPDLLSTYEERKKDSQNSAASSNSGTRKVADMVRVEAVAQDDVEELRKQLEKLGLKEALIKGKLINGLLPVNSIPRLEKIKSLKSISPVRRPKLRQSNSGAFLFQPGNNNSLAFQAIPPGKNAFLHLGSTLFWRFLPELFANSANDLRPGDLVVLGFSSDQKRIVYLTLVDLNAGTELIFTDNAWLGSRFRTSEGAFSYTVPAGGLPAGTVIDVSGSDDAEWAANGPEFNAPVSGLGNNGLNLSTGGDQVLLLTGPLESPCFIFALNGASNQFSDPANADDANRTALPPGLTPGGNALALGSGEGDEDEVDNLWYNGITSGSREQLLQAITNPANWQTDDDNFSPLTSNFTVSPNVAQEPSEHPVSFRTDILNAAQIKLLWEDPQTGTLPTDYLILAKLPSESFPSVSNGINYNDDLDFSDGQAAINVPFGRKEFLFEQLEPGQTYDFVIYPYHNGTGGPLYKTTGNPPTLSSQMTPEGLVEFFNAPCPGEETVSWTPFSVSGNGQTWTCTEEGNNQTNAIQIFGDGTDNEDWLISPLIDLGFEPFLEFLVERKLTGPALSLRISFDYVGSGDPRNATWDEISGINFPPATDEEFDFEKLKIDLGLEGFFEIENASLAFVYISSPGNGASRFTIDDVIFTDVQVVPIVSLDLDGDFPLEFSDTENGRRSEVLSYELSGENLTEALEVEAPEGFEISRTIDGSFGTGLSFEASDINSQNNSIYVRFAPNYDRDSLRVDSIRHVYLNTSLAKAEVQGSALLPLPFSSIQTLRDALDENGLPNLTDSVKIQGLALGVNLVDSGLDFIVVDGAEARQGIRVRMSEQDKMDLGISEAPQTGDQVTIVGRLSSANGWMTLERIYFYEVNSQGNTIPDPVKVDSLSEDSESRRVLLENIFILDKTQWLGSSTYTGQGFDLETRLGGDTLLMRIDGDVPLAQLTFEEVFGDNQSGIDIIGIGGQNDLSNPRDADYIFLPYQISDIQLPDLFIRVEQVNDGLNPTATNAFPIQMSLVDSLGNPVNARENTSIAVVLENGQGILRGNNVGVLIEGRNELIVNGLIYDRVDSDVQLRVFALQGDNLKSGLSPSFEVEEDPGALDSLVFLSVNQGEEVEVDLPFPISLEVQDLQGNPINVNSLTTVQISLGQGTGNLLGTKDGQIVLGNSTITIFGLRYDKAESGVTLVVDAVTGDILARGESAPFDVTSPTTALPIQFSQGSLKVFPNPSQNSLLLEWKGELKAKMEIEIYDLKGNLVDAKEGKGQNGFYRFPLEDLSAGTYYLIVRIGNEQVLKRIVKN